MFFQVAENLRCGFSWRLTDGGGVTTSTAVPAADRGFKVRLTDGGVNGVGVNGPGVNGVGVNGPGVNGDWFVTKSIQSLNYSMVNRR